MKAYLLGAALLAAALPVLADDLADANKALEVKSYQQALALYQKLAAAGNAEAQFHLGEMNWYGEGLPQNDETARTWFTKAAGAGSKEAGAALQTMAAREQHRADIDYWVQKYDGADLAAGEHACARPVFPKVSTNNEQIKDLSKSFADWQQCYNRLVEHLNSQLPPGKAIPKAVADLMNQREYDGAVARLDKVYAGVVSQQSRLAQETISAYTSWHDATAAYAKRRNEEIAADTKQVQYELERQSSMSQMAPPSIPLPTKR